MQALIEAARAADYPAEITQVISNRPEAAGLERAAAAGIATDIVDHKAYLGRDKFEAALENRVTACRAELVCLPGLMRLLSVGFVLPAREPRTHIRPSA